MADHPENTPDEPDEGNQNPFKGTPFEQFFGGAPGFGQGGTGGFGFNFGTGQPGSGPAGGTGMPGIPDLGAIFSQIQSLMQPHDGTINWDFALDLARKTVAQSSDPSVTSRQQDAVADAVRLADHWLDTATAFPTGVTSTAA